MGTTLSGTWLSGNHSGWLPCHSALREEYGAPLSTAHICAGTGLAHRQGTPQWAHTGILDLHRRNSPSTGQTRCVMAPGGMKASAAKWDRAKWDLAKWEPQRRCGGARRHEGIRCRSCPAGALRCPSTQPAQWTIAVRATCACLTAVWRLAEPDSSRIRRCAGHGSCSRPFVGAIDRTRTCAHCEPRE